jgi:ABC-type phosphate transport system substrate-binding protein
MNKTTKILWMAIVAALVLSSAVLAEVMLIANPSVQEDSLSARDIRDVFLGTRSRLAGGAVTPVLLRVGATHEEFLSTFVGRSPVQFQTHWRNIVFTGKGKALASFDSEAEVVDYIKGTSGALGYVSAGTATDGVKVIAAQ